MTSLDGLTAEPAEPTANVTVVVNGVELTVTVPVRLHVADFLRHHLGLTGTHVGCEQGVCGMCTVVVDGEAVKACLMLAVQLDGRAVQTVESLSPGDELSPLQEAFSRHHALQCGFCTPGFLMTSTALEYRGGCHDAAEIREEIAGVLCRCTGYQPIVDALEEYFAERAVSAADSHRPDDLEQVQA